MGTTRITRIDAKLMERIANRDESALTELMQRYDISLRRYLTKHVIAEEMQDEIIQDSFLKVWSHAARFIPGSRLENWLITIVRNTMLDALSYARNHYRDIALSQYLAHSDSGLIDGYSCIESVVDESNLGASFEDIVECASEILEPELLNEVISFREVESSSVRAREVGVAEGTIRWRRSEAFRQLRISRKFTNAFVD